MSSKDQDEAGSSGDIAGKESNKKEVPMNSSNKAKESKDSKGEETQSKRVGEKKGPRENKKQTKLLLHCSFHPLLSSIYTPR